MGAMGGGMPPSQQSQVPMSYPGQYMGGMQANPANPSGMSAEEQGAASQKKKQVLLVVVVGIVCLAIFITGVVLYVTTKF